MSPDMPTTPPRDDTPDDVNPRPPTDARAGADRRACRAAAAAAEVPQGPAAQRGNHDGDRLAIGIALILRAWHRGPFNSTRVVPTTPTCAAPSPCCAAGQRLCDRGAGQGLPVRETGRAAGAHRRPHLQASGRAGRGQLEAPSRSLANAEQTQAQNRPRSGRAGQPGRGRPNWRVRGPSRPASTNWPKRLGVAQRARPRAHAGTQAAVNAAQGAGARSRSPGARQRTQVSRGGLEAQVAWPRRSWLAKIDLANTVIHAPRDGQVSEASVRLGQYVTAGSQLLFLVPDTLWVVANFKEGQTWRMRIGQPPRSRSMPSRANASRATSSRSRRPPARSSACCAPITPAATSPRWCSACRCGSPSIRIRSWRAAAARHVGGGAGRYKRL
jgi:hypothetical protein